MRRRLTERDVAVFSEQEESLPRTPLKRRKKAAESTEVGLKHRSCHCHPGLAEPAATSGERPESGSESNLSLLVRGFSHDFNNLLNEVVGNLYLALEKTRSLPDVHRYLSDAEHAAYLAKDLVAQLTALALPETVVRRQIDLAKVLPGWVELTLKGAGTTCSLEIGEDLSPVWANEEQLQQVVHQIVRNAAEAMNGSGKVAISAAAVHQADGSAGKEASQVRLTVADEGRGIAGEDMKRIFDPYYTTKETADRKGLGLGLAMCQAIVARHGGRITVDSEVGKGTRIGITLPCSREADPLPVGCGPSREPAKGRVLVMDDEELDRAVAGAILNHLSYDVKFAKNGHEAITLYAAAKEKGEDFDLVIIDLVVPGGLSGRETFRKLRDMDPEVRAVLSSGYLDRSSHSQLLSEGFSAVLPKPYRIEDLQRLMDDHCDRSRTETGKK